MRAIPRQLSPRNRGSRLQVVSTDRTEHVGPGTGNSRPLLIPMPRLIGINPNATLYTQEKRRDGSCSIGCIGESWRAAPAKSAGEQKRSDGYGWLQSDRIRPAL